jgi:hypothetical protein
MALGLTLMTVGMSFALYTIDKRIRETVTFTYTNTGTYTYKLPSPAPERQTYTDPFPWPILDPSDVLGTGTDQDNCTDDFIKLVFLAGNRKVILGLS